MSRCFKFVAILLVFTLLFELMGPSVVMAMDNGKYTPDESAVEQPETTESDQMPQQDIEEPAPEEPDLEEPVSEELESVKGEYLTPITMDEFEKILKVQPKNDIEDIDAYIDRTYNEDGTITAKYYFEPIKYKDANDNWQTINPVIKKETSKNGKTAYISDESDVKLEFAQSADGKTLVKVQKDKYSISLLPVENSGKPAFNKGDVKFIDKSETIKETAGSNVDKDQSQSAGITNKNDTLKDIKEIPVKEDIIFKKESYDAIKYEGMFGASTDIVLQKV